MMQLLNGTGRGLPSDCADATIDQVVETDDPHEAPMLPGTGSADWTVRETVRGNGDLGSYR